VSSAVLVVPVPVRETVCGLPLALSVIEMVPSSMPVVLGEKVTLMVQFDPVPTADPQLLVSAKFALAAISAMFSEAVPEFVSVTVRGWLIVPATSSPNVKLVCDKSTLGEPLICIEPPQALKRKDPKSRNRKHFMIDTVCSRCLKCDGKMTESRMKDGFGLRLPNRATYGMTPFACSIRMH
jgi:hypothetical protein